MNKDFLVQLIRKDIDEMALLTKGFESMEEFPKSILLLAINKADEIKTNLTKLKDYTQTEHITPNEKYDLNDIEETIDDVAESFLEEFQEELEIDEISQDEQLMNFSKGNNLIKEQDNEKKLITQDNINFKATTSIHDKISAENQVQSLSENIANQKSSDIKQAMTLADRFLFQRELFEGNGEKMNKTLIKINEMSSLEEAQNYLFEKNNWDKENQHVQSFLNLLRKRF